MDHVHPAVRAYPFLWKGFGTTLSEGGLSSRANASDFPCSPLFRNKCSIDHPWRPITILIELHLVAASLEEIFTCKNDSNGHVELVAQEKMENAVGQFQGPDDPTKVVIFSLCGICLEARLWFPHNNSSLPRSISKGCWRILRPPRAKIKKRMGFFKFDFPNLRIKSQLFLSSLIFCMRGKIAYLPMSTLCRLCVATQDRSGCGQIQVAKHWSLPVQEHGFLH